MRETASAPEVWTVVATHVKDRNNSPTTPHAESGPSVALVDETRARALQEHMESAISLMRVSGDGETFR